VVNMKTNFEDEKLVGISVHLRKGESVESLIKRFKRKVGKSGILKEVRDRTEYLKPSVKRRKKSNDSRKRDEKDRLKVEKQIEKIKKKRRKEEVNESPSSER